MAGPFNSKKELADKVKDVTTVANAAAAPTKAEFDALVAQFNKLVNNLKDTKK